MALLALVAVVILVLSLISYIINSIFMGMIFKKASVEAWKAWVPVYNIWKFMQIGGQQGFWAVLMLIPVVNMVSLVFYYIAAYNIGLKLQKEGWFVLLAIFLPLVWLIWLALDKSTWQNGTTIAGGVPVFPGEPPLPENQTTFGPTVESTGPSQPTDQQRPPEPPVFR